MKRPIREGTHRPVTRALAVLTRGVFPHRFAWLLHFPLRRMIVSPGGLADLLPIREDSAVLEVGAGSGYFSVELARRARKGILHLLDLQPEMLLKARRRLGAQSCDNVRYTAADASHGVPFARSQIDIVLLASVLGEVSDPDRCLASLHEVLRPDGIIAIHESVPDPDRIEFGDLMALMTGHGFEPIARHGGRLRYTALFRKRGGPRSGRASV